MGDRLISMRIAFTLKRFFVISGLKRVGLHLKIQFTFLLPLLPLLLLLVTRLLLPLLLLLFDVRLELGANLLL